MRNGKRRMSLKAIKKPEGIMQQNSTGGGGRESDPCRFAVGEGEPWEA